jgi:hypothetical protein
MIGAEPSSGLAGAGPACPTGVNVVKLINHDAQNKSVTGKPFQHDLTIYR